MEEINITILKLCRNANQTLKLNISSNTSTSQKEHSWYELTLPIICIVGVVGNILNLIILSRRRLTSGMDRLERTANYGLIALTFSDMMLCSLIFPYSFLSEKSIVTTSELPILYYKLYGSSIVNLFLTSSTWLITAMAMNRYLVVVFPFRARQFMGTRAIFSMISTVYLFSIVITIPWFIHPIIDECYYNGFQYFQFDKPSGLSENTINLIRTYKKSIWPILADFIPIIILAWCNIRLIFELKKAAKKRKRTCQGQVVKETSQKVTLTLVIIILLLLFLVSPAEVIRYINPYKMWGNEIGNQVASALNIMQALNFAFNFFLYCTINQKFRNTLKTVFFSCHSSTNDTYQNDSVSNTKMSRIPFKSMVADKDMNISSV